MLTNAQQYVLTQDPDLRNRVAVEIAKKARYVLGGGGPQGGLPIMANFQIHSRARVAAANPGAEVDQFMLILAANTDHATPSDVTDFEIDTQVNANFAAIWAS